jgi:hypothetical protein
MGTMPEEVDPVRAAIVLLCLASTGLATPPVVPPTDWHVAATDIATDADGFMVAGQISRPGLRFGEAVSRPWVALTDGVAVDVLDWPPPFFQFPRDHRLAFVGRTDDGLALAAVHAPTRGSRRSRLVVWNGQDWLVYPELAGEIVTALVHEDRVIVGGRFPLDDTRHHSLKTFADGRWLLYDDGLPTTDERPFGSLVEYRDHLVVSFGGRGRPPHERQLSMRIGGQWRPFGPTFRFSGYQIIWLAPWRGQLVAFGVTGQVDGQDNPGILFIEPNRWIHGPSVPPSNSAESPPWPPAWGVGGVTEYGDRLLIGRLWCYDGPGIMLFDGSEIFTDLAEAPYYEPVSRVAAASDMYGAVLRGSSGAAFGLDALPLRLVIRRDGAWHAPSADPVLARYKDTF